MLMLMIGSLVAEKSVLPPARRLSFSAESVTAPCAETCQMGDKVIVALYPNAELPRPLVLPALVARVVSAGGAMSAVTFELRPIDAAVRDEFERYNFLRHRRELARRSSK